MLARPHILCFVLTVSAGAAAAPLPRSLFTMDTAGKDSTQQHHGHHHPQATQQQQAPLQHLQLRRTRHRILPGAALLGSGDPPLHSKSYPPSPPPVPPPNPTEIVRIVVLGDRYVGKSSVVAKFIGRDYCCRGDAEGENEDTDDKSARSAGSTSRSVRSRRSTKSVQSDTGASSRRAHKSRHRHHRKSPSRSHRKDDDTNLSGASKSSKSSSKKESTSTNESIQLISATYHRKDLTTWKPPPSSQDPTGTAGSTTGFTRNSDARVPICARVQVWDTVGDDDFIVHRVRARAATGTASTALAQDAPDSQSASTSTNETPLRDGVGRDKRWAHILKNASGAVIVCTLGDTDGNRKNSNEGDMYSSGDRRQLLMDRLERRIKRWLALIDAFAMANTDNSTFDTTTSAATERRKSSRMSVPVALVLNKSDEISTILSSSDWVRLGAQMERLCDRLGIDGGWYTSTCLDPKMLPRQHGCDALGGGAGMTTAAAWDEDCDGAELALLSLVRSVLVVRKTHEDDSAVAAAMDTAQCADTLTQDKEDRDLKENDSKGEKTRRRQKKKRKAKTSLPRTAPSFPIDP